MTGNDTLCRVWHNGPLWNALGSLMYGANSFLLLMLVSRSSGVEAVGTFGIAFTTAQLLYLLGIFGASNYQMTDYTHAYAFRTYSWLKFLSGLLMLAGGVVTCIALGFEREKTVMTLQLTLYMLAHAVSELFQSRMFQADRLDLSGKCLFFRTLFSLVCFMVSLGLDAGLVNAIWTLVLSNGVAIFLFSYLPCRWLLIGSSGAGGGTLAALIRACLPLLLAQLLMNLLLQIPKYAIEQYHSNALLGIFNMIFMPVQVINLVSSFLYRPMVKSISDCVRQRDRRALTDLIGRQTVLVGTFGLACMVGAWFLGAPVLGTFYAADLSAYRLPLLLVVSGGCVFAFCQFFYYLVLIFRKQILIFCNYGFCTAVFALICPILSQNFGILGVVLGFIVIQTILLCGYLLILVVSLRRMNDA